MLVVGGGSFSIIHCESMRRVEGVDGRHQIRVKDGFWTTNYNSMSHCKTII